MSHVTITDPHHFLFGQRLALIRERSGRGSAYVVIALADGRRRSIRVAATDLVPPGANARTLPRISIRTLIPLARHLNRILSLLTEEVIRDEPASPSASSRGVSTNLVLPTNSDRQDQPAFDGSSGVMAQSAATDTNTDRPDRGGAVAPNAADGGHARKGGGSC